MNAKEYLEGIRRIDRRIQNKQRLRQHYQEMATQATSRTEATRISGTGQHSRVEVYGLKLVDLERQLEKDVEELEERRRVAVAAMEALTDERLREVVELRYLQGYGWDLVAVLMQYDRSYVWRLNVRALQQMQERMPLGA